MAEKFKFSKKGIKCPECPSSDAFFSIVKLNGEIDKETGKCFSCGQFFTSKGNMNMKQSRNINNLNKLKNEYKT